MSELNEVSAEPQTRCVYTVVDGDPHPVRSTEGADVSGGGQRARPHEGGQWSRAGAGGCRTAEGCVRVGVAVKSWSEAGTGGTGGWAKLGFRQNQVVRQDTRSWGQSWLGGSWAWLWV